MITTDKLSDVIFKIKQGKKNEALKLLEEERITLLKQGDVIPVVSFSINCYECSVPLDTEDDYYLHLRKKHNYPEADATQATIEPRMHYEQGLQHLRTLLHEYTSYTIRD